MATFLRGRVAPEMALWVVSSLGFGLDGSYSSSMDLYLGSDGLSGGVVAQLGAELAGHLP